MERTVYLALGTNLGNRLANLQTAVTSLPPWVLPVECSPIYETPPWGYLQQPPFLNQIIRAKSELQPLELLECLQRLEVQMGRQSTFENGPRLIDIDILFYDDIVFKTPSLIIPHPRMIGRAFVLVPLADLAPDFHHPVLKKTVRDMLAEVDATGIVYYSSGDCGKIDVA